MTARPMLATSPAETPKVCQRHLRRKALVYVRQSTLKQVEENRESTQLQYGLTERASGLGWAASMIGVIDSDLGQSGRSTAGRSGFLQLVGEVGLGRVGLVLSRDVSRLSRSLADWGQLLDLCCRTDTLIADAESVYDLNRHADRFLLGVLGTVSESEIHTLRMRMHAGREAKAARGELSMILPRGYVRAEDGSVEMDPDEEVRACIRLVFDLYAACGSLSGLLKLLASREVKLPHRSYRRATRGALIWNRPNLATLQVMLRNPVYAGAFAWGKSKADGSGVRSWRHLIRDRHPAYISWEVYELNQKQLSTNVFAPRCGSRGNLMSGLLHCGRCGRRMHASYSSTEVLRHVCRGEARDYGGDTCQSFSARLFLPLVSRHVLRVLSPASLVLSRAVADNVEQDREAQHAIWRKRLGRAEQEVDRIFRQYNAIEPENRMVARSIEARYEAALVEKQRLTDAYEQFSASVPKELTEAEWKQVQRMAQDISGLWEGDSLDDSTRAAILALMIERIVATQHGSSERLDIAIHWHGGQISREQMRIPVRRFEQLSYYRELRRRVMQLKGENRSQREIADLLNAEGYRPPRKASFSISSVAKLLKTCQLSPKGSVRPRPPPADRKPNEWTSTEFATLLGMPMPTVYHWITDGVVSARREGGNDIKQRRWLVFADEAELERLKARHKSQTRWAEARRKAWDQVAGT